MKIRIIELGCCCGSNFDFFLHNPSHGYLFVKFKCAAEVLTSSGYEYAKPGDYIFYNKDEPMAYKTGDWKFTHDYFRFYLSKEEEQLIKFKTSYLYTTPLPDKLDTILQLMAVEYYSASFIREESLDLLGRLFLINFNEFAHQINAHNKIGRFRSGLINLRADIYSSPQNDWTIEKMAERLFLSTSYFQTAYKNMFGISCINDVINARIKKAEYLLLSTNKKEAEIAELCGYNHIEHFVRQFKKINGITPSAYRRKPMP